MPNATGSYRRRYNHRHPTARRARAGGLARSGHTCQACGAQEATEGHHWVYPPEEETTADHVTGLCSFCHDIITWLTWYVSFGGSRELLGDVFPVFLSQLLDRREQPVTGRVGRARRVPHGWGAMVSGESRPREGEVVAILLRCSRRWEHFVVVEVIDGRPRSWQVRTRRLRGRDEVRPVCVTDSDRQGDPRQH